MRGRSLASGKEPEISVVVFMKPLAALPPLAASVLVRLCGKDTCVCDPVVCSLVQCLKNVFKK